MNYREIIPEKQKKTGASIYRAEFNRDGAYLFTCRGIIANAAVAPGGVFRLFFFLGAGAFFFLNVGAGAFFFLNVGLNRKDTIEYKG